LLISISYSDIQGGQSEIITNNNGTVNWLDGNIDTDPLFINAVNGDYHLSDNSPCIGTGKSNTDMGAYGSFADLSDGLVAYYPFDGNANDESGNGNDGTENGGLSYGTGVSGQAASFDGTDDYIQVSNNSTLELNRHLTISYFMSPQPDPAGNPVICKNRHTGNNYSSWIRPGSAGLSFQQYPQGSTDGVEYTFRSETPLEAGKWIHVAMLRDDTAVKIYLDGVLVKEGTADYEANEKGESLFIGYDGGFGYPKFKGLLDDLRIYDRALSPAEIQTLSEQPVLSVTPAFQTAFATGGTGTFTVSNTGIGAMDWTAVSNASWLTVTGGASGSDSGTITVNYEANSGEKRTGTVTITAPGATNNPQTVEIRQSAALQGAYIFEGDNYNKQATLKNYNKFSCFMVWKYQLIDQIRITKGEHEK